MARGLEFAPDKPPFKATVDCDFCSSPCAKSYVCPGDGHAFCEACFANVMTSQTKQNGSMQQLACPMPGCGGVFADVDLLKVLPGPQAEQAHKRRRVHFEMELRQELRREIEQELAAAASRAAAGPVDGELRQSLVDEALDILMDKCRGCGQAFGDFDGCFSISCECPRNICGYCLETGTKAQIDFHIASNACPIRRTMHPDAEQDTFHQGRSKAEDFDIARRIRIQAELAELFEGLAPRERTLLAQRVRLDVLQNGVDLALAAPGALEAPQEQG